MVSKFDNHKLSNRKLTGKHSASGSDVGWVLSFPHPAPDQLVGEVGLSKATEFPLLNGQHQKSERPDVTIGTGPDSGAQRCGVWQNRNPAV